ncbi:MAG TPA: hypothetical protein VFC25_02355 [Verrucomicrobiae bacterium]|nr:hypothetical protein [Verrucomicrobiae bacterium]
MRSDTHRFGAFAPALPTAFLAAALITGLTAVPLEGSAAASAPAAPSCDHFTLEKIPLDATRQELDALGLGKIETTAQTSVETNLRVKRPKHQDIYITLHHDRVANVYIVSYVNKTSAEALLADLKARWGEPEVVNAGDKDRFPVTARTWSRSDCPAYGGYAFNGGSVAVLLSSSPSLLDYFRDPKAEIPEIIR